MLLLLLLLTSAVTSICDKINPIYMSLNYSENYDFVINRSVVYILEFQTDELQQKFPPRVTINSSNADIANPLMVVARQPKELLSWQLPMSLESDLGPQIFTNISRTLCQGVNIGNPIITVSTAWENNASFTVKVDLQEDFFINPGVSYKFRISPSKPKHFFYNFSNNVSSEEVNSNYETVILEVSSEDFVCMTVSIQNATCPVFATNEDITFRGFYETVSTKGGITIPKIKFPNGFFAVFVAKSVDSDCLGETGKSVTNRTKTITLTVKPSISYQDYVSAVVVTLTSIAVFYVLFISGFVFCSKLGYRPREMGSVCGEAEVAGTSCDLDDVSLESEYDLVEPDQDRTMRLGKSIIHLNDLARRDPRIHQYKSYLYLYNVLTVALFYGLPAIQLVITYQKVLNQTGEQDICYYNFLCAHPLGVMSDFNHVFSNSGYVLLGILFLGITYRRETMHKDLDFERNYGIPQHYGMFYAMGVALMMEGVLSGSYHICPSQANFQFDSSFMYVMAVLCMVKLYQNRHPDINATACTTFGVLAVAILFGMIGILDGNLCFWIVFTFVYLLSCLYLSIQIYYMGCWKLDRGVLMRMWQMLDYDFRTGPLNVLRPIHRARMCLLVIGNLCNWALAIWGLYKHQKDFALFLLAVFMGNTMLYFVFYIIMKYIHKERVTRLALFFLAISVLCAVSAMYFFMRKSISWSKTPAQSRTFNQECTLLRFYDYHDIWHFLSAIGMFFTFMVLLTLDDDLSHTHRTKIVVF